MKNVKISDCASWISSPFLVSSYLEFTLLYGAENRDKKDGNIRQSTQAKPLSVEFVAQSPQSSPRVSLNALQTMNCGNNASDSGRTRTAVTHIDNELKSGPISLTWTAPSHETLGCRRVEFWATVVRNYSTFWTGIKSQPYQVDAAGGEATDFAWNSPSTTFDCMSHRMQHDHTKRDSMPAASKGKHEPSRLVF